MIYLGAYSLNSLFAGWSTVLTRGSKNEENSFFT